ncbi:MAG: ion transporter [Pikeienuella sp.]|uniref:ion transporter n=1 Tax=Pikeienuella sp. TaxID=2831957 RepID=UPI00391B0E63
MTIRRRCYELLEPRHGERAGRIVDVFLICLILVNVLAVVVETVPSIYRDHEASFAAFEAVSIAIFTAEYALRLWSSVEAPGAEGPPWRARLRWMRTPGALIDLLVIAPFYLLFFLGADLRALRVVRLLRIFKLSRYSPAFTMIVHVLHREAGAFLVSFAILFVLLVLTATGAYLVEREAQPDAFGSIPAAMWWAIATLTTVGYGDVTPVTAAGKVFGGFVTAIGIGIAALPAGILAGGITAEMAARRAAMRRDYLAALLDGRVALGDAPALERRRKEYGLSTDDAAEVHAEAASRLAGSGICPHCGGALPREDGA